MADFLIADPTAPGGRRWVTVPPGQPLPHGVIAPANDPGALAGMAAGHNDSPPPAPHPAPSQPIIRSDQTGQTGTINTNRSSSPSALDWLQGWAGSSSHAQSQPTVHWGWSLPRFLGRHPGESFMGALNPGNWTNPFPHDEAYSGPTTAAPPPPPPNFGTAQISPEDQHALDTLQSLTTQDYGGTVPNVTIPNPTPSTPDPGVAANEQRATQRDSRMQALLSRMEQQASENDPTQRNWMGRLGEWLSAWAASNDWGAGGQIMSDLRRRDLSEHQSVQDRIFNFELAGLDSGDAAAAAHAATLSDAHGATERTNQQQYGHDVTQAGLNTNVAVANANNSAQNARTRAEMSLRALQQYLDAHARAQQGFRQNLQIIGRDQQYTAPAAQALAHDMADGNSAVEGPLSQGLADSQATQGLIAYVQSLAGIRRGTPAMQSALTVLRQFDPTIRDDEVEATAQTNPGALVYRLMQNPAQASVALRANQALLLRYSALAQQMQPAQ